MSSKYEISLYSLPSFTPQSDQMAFPPCSSTKFKFRVAFQMNSGQSREISKSLLHIWEALCLPQNVCIFFFFHLKSDEFW